MKFPFYSLSLVLLFSSCNFSQKGGTSQSNATFGELEHGLPISDMARADFDKGLLLLHSFEYEDAREAFEQAIAKDSTEMMAYWGVMMTHYKALWGLQDVDAGRAILNQLGPTQTDRIALTATGIERDLWTAVELLYGKGELKERNIAYSNHLAQLHEQTPNQQEIAAFYALSLLWAAPRDAKNEVYITAAKIAESVLAENPNHPGALHYAIHAYDSPELAQMGITAANRYADVAPDAVHALHMPSHIYLNRGMWNHVVSSNENSYAASVTRMQTKGLGDEARGYHSYFWLHYGYLQQGNYERANQLMQDMLAYAPSANTKAARGYLINMQNALLIETEEWPLNTPPLSMENSDLGIVHVAQQHFFQALWASKNKDQLIIKTEIDSLTIKIESAELLVTTSGISMCSAGPTRYAPNKNSILQAKTMLNQIKALKANLEANPSAAEYFLLEATNLENQTRYPYGPPNIPLPSFEQYGYWLLEQGRPTEALDQFENGLSRSPLRAKALIGKQRALEAMNRKNEASEVQAQLNQFRVTG